MRVLARTEWLQSLRCMLFCLVTAISLVCGLVTPSVAAVPAAGAPAVEQSPPTASSATAAATAPAAQDFQDDQEFNALLVVVALLFLIVVAILIVAGVLFLVLAGILLLVLLLIGVFSVTMLVGLLKRSASAAAKALIIQLLALCGIPVGIVALLLATQIMGWPHGKWIVLVVGILGGAAGGALVGYLFTLVLGMLYRAIARRFKQNEPVKGHFPVEAPVVESSPDAGVQAGLPEGKG